MDMLIKKGTNEKVLMYFWTQELNCDKSQLAIVIEWPHSISRIERQNAKINRHMGEGNKETKNES